MFKVICQTTYSTLFEQEQSKTTENINSQLSTLNVKSVSRPSVSNCPGRTTVCVTVEFNKTVNKILNNEDNLNMSEFDSASGLLIHH